MTKPTPKRKEGAMALPKAINLNTAVTGLAVTLVIQTSTAIWWAATITTKLDGVVTQLALEQSSRFTRSEAELAISSLRERLSRLEKSQDAR